MLFPFYSLKNFNNIKASSPFDPMNSLNFDKLLNQSSQNTYGLQVSQFLIQVLISSIVSETINKLSNSVVEMVHSRQMTKSSIKSTEKTEKFLIPRELEQLSLEESVRLSIDIIVRNVYNLSKFLAGENTNINEIKQIFIGLPGTGKTLALRFVVMHVYRSVKQYSEQALPVDLEKTNPAKYKQLLKQRKMAKNNELIKFMFIPGSFFDRYGAFKVDVFNAFFERVSNLLKEGHIVVIGIDEVEGLLKLNKDGRDSIAREFLFRMDLLQALAAQGKGKLILICTTNGAGRDGFDTALFRRIGNIVSFLVPDVNIQTTLFEKKIRHAILLLKEGKIKIDINLNEELLAELLKEIKRILVFFSNHNILFTGAAIENIIQNVFSLILPNVGDNDILSIYGDTDQEKLLNIFKFFMISESIRILKIEQNKLQNEIKNIIQDIVIKIGIKSSIPLPSII